MKKSVISLLVFILTMFAFITPAYAYIDPSIMTYSVQIIAGVIIAVGAVIGIYWRKAKKKIQNKLGIDENKKKEVEDEIVEFNNDESEK